MENSIFSILPIKELLCLSVSVLSFIFKIFKENYNKRKETLSKRKQNSGKNKKASVSQQRLKK
jgi:hypothetical protein